MKTLQAMNRKALMVSMLALVGMLADHAQAQSQEFELGPDDQWKNTSSEEMTLRKNQLLSARRAILEGNPQRGKDLAGAFVDRYPNSPLRAEAYLIRGDALLAMGDEYEALFEYEEIARNYPNSAAFVTALEREFEIAKQYANGRYRKLLTLFRILPATDEAQELLIRIQERLPGSRLAEQAGMTLADYYFRVRDLRMAAEAYDLFLENYPRSKDVNKARLRLIYSYLADYRGPRYDSSGLQEARLRLEDLRANEPGLAQRIGAESLLVRIYESDASKLLATAQYYLSVSDPISAEYTLRALVKRYPNSIASLEALRDIPDILAKMPKTVVSMGPDYRALRQEKLGIAWEEDTDLTGVADTPIPALPENPATTGETIIPESTDQKESSKNK
jgi:outer membrane protein assembly factor BamD (BamD/ComL family)